MRFFNYSAIAVLIAMCLLSACYYDKEDKLYPNSGLSSCDTSSTKFSTDISVIINNNCATSGCHSAGGQLPDLSTYDGVSNNIVGIQGRAIDAKDDPSRRMPAAGPLNACDLQKLQIWINKGAQNN